MASVRGLSQILESFPVVRFAFAYGSGIFEQPGLYRQRGPRLLDFVFAVDDPLQWHTQNIARHRNHYSCLATFGAAAVTGNAEQVGVGVHFNTGAVWGKQRIKYGVVAAETLRSDLCNWDTCYVSGRLHKPVQILQADAPLMQAHESNLQSALAAGILLLPPRFTLQELLAAVVGLSYTGDVRMGFAEDSRKVERIVAGSFDGLSSLYLPRLRDGPLGQVASMCSKTQLGMKSMDRAVLAKAVHLLPSTLLRRMAVLARRPGRRKRLHPSEVHRLSTEEVASVVAASRKVPHVLRRALRSIVRPASIRQAIAGLPMAGPWTSATYVWQKVTKAWRSRA